MKRDPLHGSARFDEISSRDDQRLLPRRLSQEEPAIVTATVPTLRGPMAGVPIIGERIGKYDVIREVGRGSTGTV